jgi:hypothetical protein
MTDNKQRIRDIIEEFISFGSVWLEAQRSEYSHYFAEGGIKALTELRDKLEKEGLI